jgi:transcriptional regulator with XRE-family HTH domain
MRRKTKEITFRNNPKMRKRLEEQLMVTIGANVRALRMLRGKSQGELAEACLAEQATISNIEAGKKGPSMAMLATLSTVLDVPVAYLFMYHTDISKS